MTKENLLKVEQKIRELSAELEEKCGIIVTVDWARDEKGEVIPTDSISIEDVFRAIYSFDYDSFCHLMIDKEGVFSNWTFNEEGQIVDSESPPQWLLGKPWEEQEQVHNFLFNLFFNDSK